MAQELPRYFGDATASTKQAIGSLYHWSYAFNSTVPTGNGGTASNDIYPVVPDNDIISQLASLIRDDNDLERVVQGCPDTCTAKLRAPALAPRACTTKLVPVDYGSIQAIRNAQLANTEAVPLDWEEFFISIELVLEEKESLNLVTAYPEYSEISKCTGHLNVTACTFDSAIGEYDVQIVNGKATLLNAENPIIVAWANNSAVDTGLADSGTTRSTLGSVVEFAYERYDSIAAKYSIKPGQIETITNGPGLGILREFEKTGSTDSKDGSVGCEAYTDPRPTVIRDMNKMMVWAGE